MSSDELTSVYLIEESERALRSSWEWIFEEMLSSWCEDERLWPDKRTFSMFQKWFDTRVIDLVFDLADSPLAHDDA